MKIGSIDIDKPLCLAPMEDVSDVPFRRICKEQGADLVFTEFANCEAIVRNVKSTMEKMEVHEGERPVAIQLYGSGEESLEQAAAIAQAAGPDWIDINCGCWVKKIAMRGDGAGLLRDLKKFQAVVESVMRGTDLPVTVKTRLGWDDNTRNIEEVAERLQDVGIQALTVHGRTRSQLYKGEADWTLIGRIKENPRMYIPIIGNGDITSGAKALEAKNKYGVDAIMIGRASIGNPWIFREIKQYLEGNTSPLKIDAAERVDVCREHLERSIEWKGLTRSMNEMRKHYSNYFKGFPNFKEFKIKLMDCHTPEEIYSVLEEVRHYYSGLIEVE